MTLPLSTVISSFHGFDFSAYRLPLIAVYDNPQDFPGKFAARLFDLDLPTPYVVVRDDLDAIRTERGHTGWLTLVRNVNDDPVIVETWVIV